MQATGLTAVAVQALAVTEPYRQQVADAAAPYLRQASETVSPLVQQASQKAHEASVSLAWSIRNFTSVFTG